MKRRGIHRGILPFLISIALFSGCPSLLTADEPFADFLEGLRQRGYYDTAIEHLNGLQTRTDLPAEFRETLDLERGITYREMGTASRIPEDRDQALTQAEQALKKFASEHSAHPKAAFANSELGQLLFERARTYLWDAESPSNLDRKGELQQQARALIDQAKTIYQSSHDQYKAQYEAFPKFIDQTKDEELYQQRLTVEVLYLRAWFNLVRCTYESGQTFDRGTQERNETLVRASEEFEAIHAALRTTPIGLQSRLMMGKCFQEQDDITRALGIYNEMLINKSDHPSVQYLRSIALQYRLICLNHEKKNDFQLVLQEADEWLKDKNNRNRLYSEIGLGILWEKAIAEEKLGKDRSFGDDKQRSAVLRQAMADAKSVARFPGPYREPAVAMGRRLTADLGEKDEVPKDFDTAFERARGMVSQMADLNDALAKATTREDKVKAQQAIDGQLNEIGRLFNLALELRTEDTATKAVAQARYLLSYVYMMQRKSFDAVILAQHCMTHDRLNDPDSALSATEIAIVAAIQAFNDAPDNDKQFELDLLKTICETIVSQYPRSARGNEARIRLGQVYRDLEEPLQAAQTYLTVPNDYSEYASARIQAGQSYWLAWVTTMTDIEAGREPEQDKDTIAKWKSDATALLEEGIRLTREKLGENAPPTDEVVAAEVSLATILNMDGRFADSIARLTAGGENSIVHAIAVPEGKSRPETGVQSAAFAGQTLRLLLRAYVGTQKIDDALKTMNALEAVGGQDIAAVYTQLGRELQEELERLKASGEAERLQQVRQSFEQFLEKVYTQRDKSDYNSLLWIGETYFGLGQGSAEDAVAANGYYEKANQAYKEILDSNLAEGNSILAIKLRMIRCQRAQGLYEQAVGLAQQVLAENDLSLDVQFEAAYALADWGAAADGQPEKLLASIEGVEDNGKKTIWGWSGITRRLTARQNSTDWADLKDRFLEARYEYINSRYRYAKTNAPEAEQQLKSAMGECMSFVMVFTDLDDAWFARFDKLYQDVQTELGQVPMALERPAPPEIPADEPAAEQPEPKPAAEPQADTAPVTSPIDETPNWLLAGIALALAAGGGFGAYRLLGKPVALPKAVSHASSGSFSVPTGGDMGDFSFGGADETPDFGNLAATLGGGTAVAAPPKRKSAPVGQKKPVAERSAKGKPAAEASPETPAPEKPGPQKPAPQKAAAGKPPAAAAPAATEGAKPAVPAKAPAKKVLRKEDLTEEQLKVLKAKLLAKKKAEAAAAAGQQPDKPAAAKRQLTPEELAKYKAAKLAKAKAQAQQAAGQTPDAAVKKKVVKRPPPPAE
ncbi:MAG: hypothetical protein KDA89_13630 [Planctomycetaceae bacterium]|nr:hypothetical protein [Planctomycetaceae bacterium]